MRLSESHLPVTATHQPTQPVVLDDGLAVKRPSKRPVKLWPLRAHRRPTDRLSEWAIPFPGRAGARW